jgi:hypothetical protein
LKETRAIEGSERRKGKNAHMPKKKKKFWESWGTWVGIAGGTLALIVGIIELPKKIQENILPAVHKEKFEGIVIDTAGNSIAGAVVTIDLLPGVAETTATAGGFLFEKVPGQPGDRVRVFVARPGFKNQNFYKVLPGPARITLEKQ